MTVQPLMHKDKDTVGSMQESELEVGTVHCAVPTSFSPVSYVLSSSWLNIKDEVSFL